MIPISKNRNKQRGYNQSLLIAQEVARIFSIKLEKNILIKIADKKPQSSLNKMEREENVKGVYSFKNVEKITNKKILIFDDIYTTGNTVNECAKLLVNNGINKKNIGILTIAKD